MNDKNAMHDIMHGIFKIVSIIHHFDYQNTISYHILQSTKIYELPGILYIIKIESNAIWWYQQEFDLRSITVSSGRRLTGIIFELNAKDNNKDKDMSILI